MVGVRVGCEFGNQLVAQKPGRRGFSSRRSVNLSRCYQAVVASQSLEAPPSAERTAGRITDRRALAHPGDTAKSSLFRLHDAQRSGRISRLPMVLLHQRAAAPFLEHALSARL